MIVYVDHCAVWNLLDGHKMVIPVADTLYDHIASGERVQKAVPMSCLLALDRHNLRAV